MVTADQCKLKSLLFSHLMRDRNLIDKLEICQLKPRSSDSNVTKAEDVRCEDVTATDLTLGE